MLYVVYDTGCESIYYMKNFPFKGEVEKVVAIQADGDELEHIKTVFPTMPFPNKPVVNFPKEMAQYILMNI